MIPLLPPNPEVYPLIVREFNGQNQLELANKYKVSLQLVYSLLLNQQVSNASRLLHLNEEIGQQVLWAGQATQLDSRHGLRAALQALEKAADLDSSGRALVVISYLPEVPVTDPDGDNQATSPSDSVEIQPSSQSHDCKEKDQPAHFQSDSIKHPDNSLHSPKVEPYSPEQVRGMFALYGVPLTDFCRTHKIRYNILTDLIMGRNSSLSHAANRAAVILGMKQDPITKQINNPFNGLTPLPYKRNFLV